MKTELNAYIYSVLVLAVIDEILYGRHLADLTIRDGLTECILEGHVQLYEREGIHLEVLLEACLRGNLLLITCECIYDNVLNLLEIHFVLLLP